MFLIFTILMLITGLVLITYSADYFTDGAVSLAKNLKISTLTIGIFVLGFGTSAPEIVISIISALNNLPGLAVGNVIGSNIANIGMVLGVAAIIYPISVKKKTLKFETNIMIFLSIFVVLIIGWDFKLSYVDGWLLIFSFIPIVYLIFKQKLSKNKIEKTLDDERIIDDAEMSLKKSIYVTLISLVILVASARLFVWSAGYIASYLGVNDIVIGLTIVAIGTSLPELAAAISASLKKESELTLGNILGSNMFNILAVLPFPAFFGGLIFSNQLFWFDLMVMLAFAISLPMFILLNKNLKITRFVGCVFIVSYLSYVTVVVFNSI